MAKPILVSLIDVAQEPDSKNNKYFLEVLYHDYFYKDIERRVHKHGVQVGGQLVGKSQLDTGGIQDTKLFDAGQHAPLSDTVDTSAHL